MAHDEQRPGEQLDGDAIAPEIDSGTVSSGTRRPRKRTIRWLLAGALALLVAGGVGVFAHYRSTRPAPPCVGVGLEGPSAPTERAALDAFLDLQGTSKDGWAPSEPNRFSKMDGDRLMVIDVSQVDGTWRVYATSTCG